MSYRTQVEFRGEMRDVLVTRDGGYEPDTDSHAIDWEFDGLAASDHDALQITPEEHQAIFEALTEDW